MAYAGQSIVNPVTGEHFMFLKTAADTQGQYILFDCRVEPGKATLPPHVHATQEERFEIVSGTLGVMVGGEKYTLQAGQRIVLPARIKHQWWNAGDDEVHFRVEVVPPRNLEATIEAIAGMAVEGKLNKRAMPRNPFLLANLGRFSETYLPVVPIWMQRSMLAVGSTMGRALGYDPTFSQYRSQPVYQYEYETEVAA